MRENFAPIALIVAAAAGPAMAADKSGDWSYTGDTGPEHWGALAKDYEMCDAGRQQSPIDLAEHNALGELMVSVDYQSGPVAITDTGSTVLVEFEQPSSLTSGTTTFNLVQVHFHTPSEHAISGERYPLVAHFVHAAESGALAVLGVMYEPGEANAALDTIIDGAHNAPSDVSLDPQELLPETLDVYRYQGSLTTPPCSEGVHWHVAAEPVTASEAQIAALEELMGMNARPVQPLNGRLLVAPQR